MATQYYEVIWDMRIKRFSDMDEAIDFSSISTKNSVEHSQALIIAKSDDTHIVKIFGCEWVDDNVFIMCNLNI